MRNFFCDFETYYDKDYSLSKMPTEQYIMDDRFEAIMMSYSTGGDVFVAIGEERIKKVLAEQDWANTMVISHNTNFDGLILRHRFGVKAARYADTMAMARTTGAHIFGGASLDAVAKVLHQAGVKIPFKGNAVHNNSYKHLYRHSPTNQYYMRETPLKDGRDPETLAVLKKCSDDFSEYVVYCRTDTLICMKAYEYFRPLITNDEMMFADMMIKCMVDPIFYLDEKMLEEELVRLEERNKIELQACADKYFGGSVQKTLTTFRSAKQFSEMLRSLGGVTQSEADEMTEEPLFIIPTKINDSGKESFTFGKTSLEFLELAEGDIPEVSELCKLKLECTSSIEKSRTQRFLDLARLRDMNGNPLPFSMPYIVNQAGTLRLSGGDGINIQNLPSGRKKGQSKALRKSIMSPQGYSIVVSDSSQVECIWGECLVLTDKGTKKIRDVSTSDLVYDGVKYVSHNGVIYKGEKDVIEYNGIIGTPEHIVYDTAGQPISLDYAASTKAEIQSAGTEWEALWGLGSTEQTHTANDKENKVMVQMQMWYREISGSSGFEEWFVDKMQKLRIRPQQVLPLLTEKSFKAATGEVQRNGGACESEQIYEQDVQECGEQVQILRRFHKIRMGNAPDERLRRDGAGPNRHQRSLRKREHSVCNEGAERTNEKMQPYSGVQRGGPVGGFATEKICTKYMSRRSSEVNQAGENSRVYNKLCKELQEDLCSCTRGEDDKDGLHTQVRGSQYRISSSNENDKPRRYTKLGNPIVGTVKVYDIVNCGDKFRFCCNGLIVSNCRTLAYASNESWLLEAFAKGRDPYSIMASFIYGGNPDEIKKQAKAGVQPFYNQRQVGKTAILSSGYGSGAAAFKAMLKVQSGLDFTLEECQDIVKTYRTNNREIANFWNKCSKVLDLMIAGQSGYFGGPNNDLFFYDGNHKVHGVTMPSVRLPDGNWLRYYKLERKMREYPDGSQKMNYCYWGVKERKAQIVWIYGSKFAENLIQALAFALMKQQALLINKWSPIRLNTHDECGICVPTDYAQAGLDYMLACMKWTPQWAAGLPLDAEGDFALRYGECK